MSITTVSASVRRKPTSCTSCTGPVFGVYVKIKEVHNYFCDIGKLQQRKERIIKEQDCDAYGYM